MDNKNNSTGTNYYNRITLEDAKYIIDSEDVVILDIPTKRNMTVDISTTDT